MELIEVAEYDFIRRLWDENENLKHVVWRHWPNFEGWEDDPEGTAARAVAEIGERIVFIADLITHITTDNEFIFDQNHSSLELIDKADRYIAAFIREADVQLGKGVCWGQFNTGHYDESFVNLFARSLEESVVSGRSYPCFHEYDWPTLKGDGGYWLCGRYKRIMGPVVEKYPSLRCGISEIGIDYAVIIGGEHRGFRQTRDNLDEAVDLYCGDQGFTWYYEDLEDYVEFVLIFGCGMYYENNWGEWGFDIANTEVIDRVAALSPEPDPPEPPVNGGNGMDYQVFDMEGNELSGDEATTLVKKHGLSVATPADLKAGQMYYKVTAFREKTGNTAFIFRALDENGQPIVNPDEALDRNKPHRAWWWPDVGQENDIITPFATDWFGACDIGGFNENGEGGSPMGAWHSENEPGPYKAWVRDVHYHSQLVEGAGMLDMTNHDHMDAEWTLTVYEGETPPGDTAERILGIVGVLREQADELEEIAAEVDGAPSKVTLTYPDGRQVDYGPTG